MDGTKREHKSEAGIPKKTIMYIHKYAVAGPTETPTIKTNKADNPIRIKMIGTRNKYNKTAVLSPLNIIITGENNMFTMNK